MNINVKFTTTEFFLPTKRHKKARSHRINDTATINVPELNENNFPVAFVIHDMKSVYENAKDYNDFEGRGDYRMFSEEIRTYNGNLYMPVRVTHGAAISTLFEPVASLADTLRPYCSYRYNIAEEELTETAVITRSDREEKIAEITSKAEQYVICNGVIWKTCGEPMYNIVTFGLGHNHGGTGFFIEYAYNNNISAKNYFNALQREEAIEYGKAVALRRGDTNSVDEIGKYKNIEVIMPEMVKRNPKAEHGEGDRFINAVEEIVNASNNSLEAGILTIALTASNNI